MAIAEVSYERILRDAQQLTRTEQAQLIGQLAQELVVSHSPSPTEDKMAALAAIRRRLRESGYTPRTAEEVDAYIEAERNSWDA